MDAFQLSDQNIFDFCYIISTPENSQMSKVIHKENVIYK